MNNFFLFPENVSKAFELLFIMKATY